MFNIKKLVVLLLCAGLVFQAHFGIAGPQGGKVVGGNANISQSGPNTTINQTSDRAIINWNSFDIGKNESVRHNMPSSNSAGLHRVVGKGGPSQIEGVLQSNGNIYLVNPAGVVIHNGAKIDVNGFVATSRDIANENFMKGKMVFDKPGLPGAAIINQGNISLRDNGLAALVAPTVRNDGIIAGKLGKVALGGSDAAWKLDMTGDDLIAFTVDEKQVNTLYAADGTPLASVENNGKIKAEGGVVVLTASQLDGIVGSVVNNGEISAASAETKGGKIIFRGQGNKVDVVNNGQLDVSSKAAEGGLVRMTGQAAVIHAGKIDATGKTKGGNVVITGENVTLKFGSRIDASGTNGGGTVLVGGNARGKGPETNAKTTLVQTDAEILADAKLYGDGGNIVVWADEKTQFDGKATARGGENGGNGGLVETSAKLLIIGDPAVVNTSAKKGKAGEWLLDPEDLVIAAAGGTMTGQQISDSLENNNVTIETGDDGEGNGDIFLNDKIEWNNDTILTINAYRNILIGATIRSKGNNSGLIINTKTGDYQINDGKINLLGDNPTLIINGDEYVVIKDIETLENMPFSYENNYLNHALVNDIDMENKIHQPFSQYHGKFEGLGNTIYNITIMPNADGDDSYRNYCGFFSDLFSGSKVSNLYIVNANFYANKNTIGGILAGTSSGTINNVHVKGNIYAKKCVAVGGLIGSNDGNILRSSSDVTINIEESAINVGGLVGSNYYSSIDKSKSIYNLNVYNDASSNDPCFVGGFVGNNDGSISNSISIGKLVSNGDNIYSGGFVGWTDSSTISNCYTSSQVEGNNAGSFAGSVWMRFDHSWGVYPYTIINCYWDKTNCELDKPIYDLYMDLDDYEYFYDEPPAPPHIVGLTSDQMRQQSSFKDWDFKNIWKIDEGKSFPELRGVANNDIVFPDKPINPNPDPKPDPDNPDPKPDTPDTPDNPDVPVNPDPKPDNPDKPVNPDPKPDTPVTPEQPSNPGTNPGDTPSQPSTKPDTKPNKPDSNQPVQPERPVTPVDPSNPGTNPGGDIPWHPDASKPSNPINPPSSNRPIYDGKDEFGGNYIYVDNLSPEDRKYFQNTLPGTPIYVIDKEISSSTPEMYVIDMNKYNERKEEIAKLKTDTKNLCDTVTKKGVWDIALTGLRVEIQKLFSMFFNTEFIFDSGKFSSNTMKAIKAALENDHVNNLLKSNSYRLIVGYYLALASYIDEAMKYLNKAEDILNSPLSYAQAPNAYYSYLKNAERYMQGAQTIYENKARIEQLFNEFAIYETATTLAGAATDTIVDKTDKKISKYLIPKYSEATNKIEEHIITGEKSVEQAVKMGTKKEVKKPMKMKTITAEDVWNESLYVVPHYTEAKNIYKRNFNEIFG